MLFIGRDEAGNIIALHNKPEPGIHEQKSVLDEEILKFLNNTVDRDPLVQLLSLTDASVIRIVEDLIELLIRKNIIHFTELPEAAQTKINERRRVRQQLGPDHLVVDDIL